MKPISDSSSYASAIAVALKTVQFWLDRDNSSELILAAPTIKQFREQSLPTHLRITPKKRQGKRVVVRERRHYHQPYPITARWPEDGLVENPLPSLACVMRGQADLIVADYVMHLQPGDLLLYPVGIPKQDGSKVHFEEDPIGETCDIFWIRPQDNGLRCWICRSEETKHRIGPDLGSCWVPNRFLNRMFTGLVEDAEKGRKRNTTKLLLAALLKTLCDEVENGNALKDWGRPRYDASEQDGGPITEALAYIEENLDQHLTIEDVAREALVSSATFTRRFKERTGQTFSEYQTKLRMKIAEDALINSDASIIAICRRVGLQHGRLLKLFHEKHGCSPGMFRQQKTDQKRRSSSG